MQPEVIIYCTGLCPYCWRARKLIKDKGVEFTEIRVDKQPERWDEMVERSGRNTVPQIFIGGAHVGGYDDMAAIDREGALDGMLGL